jgi:hypothetical protein
MLDILVEAPWAPRLTCSDRVQVCKFFLDAVEKSQYGWFWECPNGVSCHYRYGRHTSAHAPPILVAERPGRWDPCSHALPPGFTLKRDKKKDDGETKISIDEFIETEVRVRCN